MNKSFIIPLLAAIFVGFLSSRMVYAIYNPKKQSNYNSYFIQYGVYSDENVLKEELKKLKAYTISKEKDKTYVYLGITTKKDNADKIKKVYEKKGIETYIKRRNVASIEFLKNLEQYDILVDSVSKDEDLISILNVILSTYEETLKTS